MAAADDRISLKSAISALRRELKEAAEDAKGLGPGAVLFRVSDIEVELTIVAEDSATAGAEVGWWIFKGKADITAKDAVTHRVKLKLNVGDLDIGSSTDAA